MTFHFFKSIWFRILALVFIAAFPALVIIITSVQALRVAAITSANASARSAVQVIAAYQDRLIDGGRQFLNTLSLTPDARERDSAKCGAFMATLLAASPQYLNIGVVDQSGTVYCSGLPVAEPVDASDRLWFREAVRTKAFAVGEYQIGRIAKEPSLNFGYPLIASDGSVEAVMYVALNLNAFNTIARAITLSPDDVFVVFDRNGVVLYRHPHPEDWIGKAVPDSEIVRTLLGKRQEGVVEVADIDGVRRLFAFRPLALSPEAGTIYIAFGIPIANAFAEADRILKNNLIVFGVVTVFMLIWAWFVAYLVIVRRVRLLAGATDQLSHGDLSARLGEIGGPNEFRSLAQSFDRMAASIEERTGRIEREVAKTRALLSSIGDGVIAIDKKMKVAVLNPAAEAMLGITAAEAIGKSFGAVVSILDHNQKQLARDERPEMAVLKTGKTFTTGVWNRHEMLYFVRRDKTAFPITATVTPEHINGVLFGAVIAFRDVTAEWNIDRAKSEFVSLASHQLRTPIAIINWHLELLLEGGAGVIAKKPRQYLVEAYEASARMATLVDSLLNASRIEAGALVMNPGPTDFAALAHTIVRALAPEIQRKKLSVEERYDPKLTEMMADPKLIEIIFDNLISNAVKFTPEGGRVTVGIAIVGPNLQITVADTGFGIPRGEQSKVFTKLFRAENVRHLGVQGTGLGLYFVKVIVEELGGAISFTSEEERGTVFTVIMPRTGVRGRMGTKRLT